MSGTNITRLEASERSAVVQAQTYEIELDLSTRDDTFSSKTTVHFTAREDNSTWIDFIAPKVQSIELNGESLDTDGAAPIAKKEPLNPLCGLRRTV